MADNKQFQDLLTAERVLVILHTSWSAYSFASRAALQEWERTWSERHPEKSMSIVELDPDEQSFVKEWLGQGANSAIRSLERRLLGTDRWASGTGTGDYGSIGTGPIVALRRGEIVEFEGAPTDMLADPKRREEWERRIMSALWSPLG